MCPFPSCTCLESFAEEDQVTSPLNTLEGSFWTYSLGLRYRLRCMELGSRRWVGGPAGDMSTGLGDKGVGLLLVTFLCRASLSSGKEESEVRYGI